MEPILGYVEPFIVASGQKIELKVSCSSESYTSTLLRLGPGAEHSEGPPVKHTVVDSIKQSEHKGRLQYSQPGSYALINSWHGERLNDADSLLFSFWCQSTLPVGAGHEQNIFSTLERGAHAGLACLIDEDGALKFVVGDNVKFEQVHFDKRFLRNQWCHLFVKLNFKDRTIGVEMICKGRDRGERTETWRSTKSLQSVPVITSCAPLVIAGDSTRSGAFSTPTKSSSFNGKIDSFKLESFHNDVSSVILQFDFAVDMTSDHIRDVSGNGIRGDLVNGPARAVTGHDWDASEVDWRKSSYGYGAIHFHDDDIDDSAWETDFELTLPNDVKSGCYGVLVDDGTSTDIIPFFVRPTASSAKVALIMPTFTYAAYANDHTYDTTRDVHIAIPNSENVQKGHHLRIIERRPDLGISLYDSHNDGSGTVFSSTKRPLMNVRPNYCHWGFGGPRELAADLWFIGFLDRELGAGNYDVLTDHQLNAEGAELLQKYKVLLSCSHPEYPTYKMLDAYTSFLDGGGYFLYLGGNGYYWVTANDPERPHRIEVRRADQGCRSFGLPPGNWHHSLTGEHGGLWRARGRPSNELFGLGSAAAGMGKGAAYGIRADARADPRVGFLFRGGGLESEDIIGDFGLVQGAASGDEIDRLDFGLGTPASAVIVATTVGHSNNYCLFNEDIMFPMTNTTGESCEKVRSDLIYFETESGGAVLSVGSINWVGALAWMNYENNIAKITSNALHEFISRP